MVPLGRRWRSLAQQHRGAGVDLAAGEHAAVGREQERAIADRQRYRGAIGTDVGMLVEVMGHRATSLPNRR